MNSSCPDSELLQTFVKTKDQASFSELSKRYLGLIFNTSYRILSDHGLAEDATQRTLITLAKKASSLSRGKASIAPWLHKVATNEALTLRRTEVRQRHKINALQNEPAGPQSHGNSRWQETLPILDQALAKLPEKDRDLLLNHFLKGRTFPEIATETQRSISAVQKQSQRALTRLQRLMNPSGATLSVTTLTVALSTELSKAAPAPDALLAKSATTIKLASATTAGAAFSKTTLIAIAGTTLCCATPLAIQQWEIQELRTHLAENSATPPETQPSSERLPRNSISTWEKRLEDLRLADSDYPRFLAIKKDIKRLSEDQLLTLIGQLDTLSSTDKAKRRFLEMATTIIGKHSPGRAVESIMPLLTSENLRSKFRVGDSLVNCIEKWMQSDPQAVINWWHNNEDFLEFISVKTYSDRLTHRIRKVICSDLAFQDLEAAHPLLEKIYDYSLITMLSHRVRHEKKPVSNKSLTTYLEICRRYLPENIPDRAHPVGLLWRKVAHMNTNQKGVEHPFKKITALFEEHEFSHSEILHTLKNVGFVYLENAIRWTENKPPDHVQYVIRFHSWLETQNVQEPTFLTGRLMGCMFQSPDKIIRLFELLYEQEEDPDYIRGFLSSYKLSDKQRKQLQMIAGKHLAE